jgi:hypothetical protein
VCLQILEKANVLFSAGKTHLAHSYSGLRIETGSVGQKHGELRIYIVKVTDHIQDILSHRYEELRLRELLRLDVGREFVSAVKEESRVVLANNKFKFFSSLQLELVEVLEKPEHQSVGAGVIVEGGSGTICLSSPTVSIFKVLY